MTQEQKDLLFKDLCARLPYGVKCYIPEANDTSILAAVLEDGENTLFYFWEDSRKIQYWHQLYISEFKPYLFPLSSMTEEQIKEYKDALVYHDYVGGGWTMAKTFDDEYVVPYWFVDFCNKHHLDYKGLIPKGLAIDCTNLNIY